MIARLVFFLVYPNRLTDKFIIHSHKPDDIILTMCMPSKELALFMVSTFPRNCHQPTHHIQPEAKAFSAGTSMNHQQQTPMFGPNTNTNTRIISGVRSGSLAPLAPLYHHSKSKLHNSTTCEKKLSSLHLPSLHCFAASSYHYPTCQMKPQLCHHISMWPLTAKHVMYLPFSILEVDYRSLCCCCCCCCFCSMDTSQPTTDQLRNGS